MATPLNSLDSSVFRYLPHGAYADDELHFLGFVTKVGLLQSKRPLVVAQNHTVDIWNGKKQKDASLKRRFHVKQITKIFCGREGNTQGQIIIEYMDRVKNKLKTLRLKTPSAKTLGMILQSLRNGQLLDPNHNRISKSIPPAPSSSESDDASHDYSSRSSVSPTVSDDDSPLESRTFQWRHFISDLVLKETPGMSCMHKFIIPELFEMDDDSENFSKLSSESPVPESIHSSVVSVSSLGAEDCLQNNEQNAEVEEVDQVVAVTDPEPSLVAEEPPDPQPEIEVVEEVVDSVPSESLTPSPSPSPPSEREETPVFVLAVMEHDASMTCKGLNSIATASPRSDTDFNHFSDIPTSPIFSSPARSSVSFARDSNPIYGNGSPSIEVTPNRNRSVDSCTQSEPRSDVCRSCKNTIIETTNEIDRYQEIQEEIRRALPKVVESPRTLAEDMKYESEDTCSADSWNTEYTNYEKTATSYIQNYRNRKHSSVEVRESSVSVGVSASGPATANARTQTSRKRRRKKVQELLPCSPIVIVEKRRSASPKSLKTPPRRSTSLEYHEILALPTTPMSFVDNRDSSMSAHPLSSLRSIPPFVDIKEVKGK
eukprot:TRINITY_DN7763_c1_g1_i1.p1 TRINITY_DN7763_c1_g1~~TRINITY_DN7763_c1_g1_i1.p1  ORF type:complete len:598 (+),score=86.75 TRINITY_DN7763_c1_g1_i1:110-1903(+)